MDRFEQCVRGLLALEPADERDLALRVDALIDPYLASFGAHAAPARRRLADAFLAKAPVSTARDRIRARIMREDHKRPLSLR
jgi:hypothetical protein